RRVRCFASLLTFIELKGCVPSGASARRSTRLSRTSCGTWATSSCSKRVPPVGEPFRIIARDGAGGRFGLYGPADKQPQRLLCVSSEAVLCANDSQFSL